MSTTSDTAPRPVGSAAINVDAGEVAKFAALAEEWWNPKGPFKPLHRINPLRLAYIRDAVCARFGRNANAAAPLHGLRVADIGCGGGLLCEPMARLGADVVGVDAAEPSISAAAHHAVELGLTIDYRCTTAETLVADGERFDVVLNMEVIEHVPDRSAFLATAAALLTPKGLMIVASINRTPKAFLLAIVGAEYVLRWLPIGSHSYARLVRPEEVAADLRAAGLEPTAAVGVSYDILADRFAITSDLAVNYMMCAGRR